MKKQPLKNNVLACTTILKNLKNNIGRFLKRTVKILLILSATFLIGPNGNTLETSSSIDYKNITQLKKDEEVFCLAQNIFWEARGESFEEKVRVSNVTHNRVKNKRFPQSFCGVIYQKNAFSWTKSQKSIEKAIKKENSYKTWVEAMTIAHKETKGLLKDTTGGALFFHARYISKPKDFPNRLTVVSKSHKFYK